VHSLIEDHEYRFALTGSSARKLKKGGANLLAGRAVMKHFFPLVYPEWREQCSLADVLKWGSLPGILRAEPHERVELLETYTGTYLREEIKEEALTRNVGSFARFFQVASLTHSQMTQFTNLSRDAAVPRATVAGYYEILIDTLVGDYLPAWQPKKRVKEVEHPKFYFFDCGVVRSLQGKLREPINEIEMGILLETYLLHELKAYQSYKNIGGDFYYWRTPDQIEVDFIWSRGPHRVGIEVKSSKNWKESFEKGLKILKLKNSFGVYQGPDILKKAWGYVFPVEEFLKRLWSGEILE
jgi:predicted AAA+ superfamily ATPase